MAGPRPKGFKLLKAALATRKSATMLAFGFSSGLPFALLIGTLTAWLGEVGVKLATIGIFSWIGLAYSFKFLWSPVVDRLQMPGLERIGRRKSWIALCQVIIVGVPRAARADQSGDLDRQFRAARLRGRIGVGKPRHRDRRMAHRSGRRGGADRAALRPHPVRLSYCLDRRRCHRTGDGRPDELAERLSGDGGDLPRPLGGHPHRTRHSAARAPEAVRRARRARCTQARRARFAPRDRRHQLALGDRSACHFRSLDVGACRAWRDAALGCRFHEDMGRADHHRDRLRTPGSRGDRKPPCEKPRQGPHGARPGARGPAAR